jgi:hypothetical protein
MRTFEVLDKEVDSVKLTVAVDRVSVKFPLGTAEPVKAKVVEFAKVIDVKMPDVQFTMRGRFKFNGDHMMITLTPKTSSSVQSVSFASSQPEFKGMPFYTGA